MGSETPLELDDFSFSYNKYGKLAVPLGSQVTQGLCWTLQDARLSLLHTAVCRCVRLRAARRKADENCGRKKSHQARYQNSVSNHGTATGQPLSTRVILTERHSVLPVKWRNSITFSVVFPTSFIMSDSKMAPGPFAGHLHLPEVHPVDATTIPSSYLEEERTESGRQVPSLREGSPHVLQLPKPQPSSRSRPCSETPDPRATTQPSVTWHSLDPAHSTPRTAPPLPFRCQATPLALL